MSVNQLKRILLPIVCIVSFFFHFSCIKENDFNYDKLAGSNWDPDLALPLIQTSINIQDISGLVDSANYSTDSNHLLKLIYTGNIYSIGSNHFLPVLNQSDDAVFSLNASDSTLLYQSGTITKTISHFAPFIFQNGTCDSMLVESGQLDISLVSDIPHSGILNITIPDAIKNGQSLSCQLPFTWSGSATTVGKSIDLSGYFINLSGSGIPGVLTINYSITYNNSTSLSAVTGHQSAVHLDFNAIHFKSIYGNFGQQAITLFEDSALITLFSNFQNGTLYFDDPSLTFTLKNSFGMPIDAHVSSLTAINRLGQSFPITGAIPDPLPIGFPSVAGQSAISSFTLDKNNSNVRSIISQCPKYITYSLNATSNAPNPAYNFLLDTSEFRADIKIELPMRGYASGFTIQDTVDFRLDKINDLKNAIFRINIDNGFPANAYTQIYFTDAGFNILDSMILDPSHTLIESAQVNSAGKVIASTHKMLDEPFPSARLDHLYQTKKMLIRSLINTADFQTGRIIEIYDDYKIDVKVGVRADFNIH